MNDDTMITAVRGHLSEVRDSLGDVHMTIPASAIFARARTRRRNRVLAAAGAACAAIGVVVALVLAPGSQARPVHIHLAAWSVDTNANGTVTFTLQNASQPGRLQHALAEAGVPAMVRWGEICLAQGRHVLLPTEGFLKATGVRTYVNGRPTSPESILEMIATKTPNNKGLNWSWTITTSKMPKGAQFVISGVRADRVAPGHIQAVWEVVPSSAHVVCAKSVNPD
ncbi:MAG: hypothetical protein J2P33_13475 [Actinobacteria bacterium]|nr:hypothetical protein [Actinomycetota bacterium]